MSFQNKIAVVTGAASGIGAATARQLAERGARVVVVDLSEKAGEKATAALNASGVAGSARFQKMDVADWSSVQAGFSTIKDRFGQIDILINNAGIG